MNIEKLPSGSYRIRQMHNGKYYSVTVPYKPTKKEASELIHDKIKDGASLVRMTFRKASEEYISLKENVLSVRTVREYSLMPDRLPSWFTSKPISSIDQTDIQRCINQLSADKSPKTVRVIHGYISAVLRIFKPNMVLRTTLPQNIKNEPYIPTSEEVKAIIDYTKENAPHFYVPLMLACWGLRRSEILAIQGSDIEGSLLHINKAMVEDKEGNWVVKTTKTESSTRDIYIPEDVAAIIKQQGYAYKGGSQSVGNYLSRVQNKLGIKHFSLHKLRHKFASDLFANGVTEADVMELGGWVSTSVLKSVYRHAISAKTDEGKKKISNLLFQNLMQ